MTTTAGAAALKWYTDLQMTDKVTSNTFMDEAQAAFKAGRAGMHRRRLVPDRRAAGGRRGWTGAWPNCRPGRTAPSRTMPRTGSTRSPASRRARSWPRPRSSWPTSPRTRRCRSGSKTVGELPAKPSAALTDANKADPVYGPFIAGLGYAHATIFADETGQRDVLVDAVNRVFLEGADRRRPACIRRPRKSRRSSTSTSDRRQLTRYARCRPGASGSRLGCCGIASGIELRGAGR